MERFSVIFFSLCSLVILAESTPTEWSTTIETLDAHEVRNINNHHLNLKQDNTKYCLTDKNSVKNSTENEEHAKDSSNLDSASNTFTTLVGDSTNSNIKDTQHSRSNDNREDDTDHKEDLSVDLSSHDILLDPGLISARLSRQAKKSDYSNPASIKNIFSDVKSNNHESVLSSKHSLNYKSDLSMDEDRYLPPYSYWNPYYRRQFPNQRYQTNDRREHYRNYWRYPVFPGK